MLTRRFWRPPAPPRGRPGAGPSSCRTCR
jgi:hypothetical protein